MPVKFFPVCKLVLLIILCSSGWANEGGPSIFAIILSSSLKRVRFDFFYLKAFSGALFVHESCLSFSEAFRNLSRK